MYQATKVVIITEMSILERVAEVIEAQGATGYTHSTAGGKGSRGKRSAGRGAQVAGLRQNVKIETIVANHDIAEAVIEAVAAAFFEHYSGIAYVEPVEILRPHKFKV